jgi:hypothetical protein
MKRDLIGKRVRALGKMTPFWDVDNIGEVIDYDCYNDMYLIDFSGHGNWTVCGSGQWWLAPGGFEVVDN